MTAPHSDYVVRVVTKDGHVQWKGNISAVDAESAARQGYTHSIGQPFQGETDAPRLRVEVTPVEPETRVFACHLVQSWTVEVDETTS